MVWPSKVMVPESAVSMPNKARATSVRREPTSPAKPTTSPACTSKLMSWKTFSLLRLLTERSKSPRSVVDLAKKSSMWRPTMSRMADSGVTSAAGCEETKRPSLKTVTRSEIVNTSSIRWLMNKMETPFSLSRRVSLKSWSTSCAESEAVGSSIIKTRVSSEIALAISTACCAARVKPRAELRTSSLMSSRAKISAASRYICRQRTMPPRLRWPIKIFSATLRSGKIIGSWWMAAMPLAWASRGLVMGVERPSSKISPSSGL